VVDLSKLSTCQKNCQTFSIILPLKEKAGKAYAFASTFIESITGPFTHVL